MIQFLGLDFSVDQVRAASLARNLEVTAEFSTPVVGTRLESGVTTVRPAEWVRAGTYALQEIYRSLPVADRQVWGIGLASAAGWIALDFEFEPLGDLRLMPATAVCDDLRSSRDREPRRDKRVSTILGPKDYFRFAISRSLAADVTQASRQEMLAGGRNEWLEERLDEEDLPARWMPPVFDSQTPTGRLSEEGIRLTGLPGGTWLIAGALSDSCAMVASGDLRRNALWAPVDRPLLAYGVPAAASHDDLPPGFRCERSAIAGEGVLEKELPATGADAAIDEAREALRTRGFSVARIERQSGRPEVGAAALAAVGSGLIRTWDLFYKKLAG